MATDHDPQHVHQWRDVTPRGSHDVHLECNCGDTRVLALPKRDTITVNGL